MPKLICDICGTSYSDNEDKCPTCGYSRAFTESDPAEGQIRAAYEKVRGGRFSKKNVRRRMKLQAEAGVRTDASFPAPELPEELNAAVAALSAADREETVPAAQSEPDVSVPDSQVPEQAEPAAPAAAAQMDSMAAALSEELNAVINGLDEMPEAPEMQREPEEVFAAEEDDAPESPEEAESIQALSEEEETEALVLPVEFPEEEPAAEDQVIAGEFPDQEPEVIEEEPEVLALPVELPEEAPDVSGAEEPDVDAPMIPVEITEEAFDISEAEEPEADAPVTPVVLPEEALPAEEEPAQEQEKKKGGMALNVVLFISVAAFLASAIYLLINYGIPYLKEFEWPTQAVVETTVPTEESTEALTEAPTEEPTEAPTEAPTEPPTEAPTQAPTEPPTEAPTEPPTEPPTEAPTKPLLDVKLTLNYYDLTFGAASQTTQLKTEGIPLADVTWVSDDPNVVTISETGLITAVGHGKTTVHAIYGDQEVTVKINCPFR